MSIVLLPLPGLVIHVATWMSDYFIFSLAQRLLHSLLSHAESIFFLNGGHFEVYYLKSLGTLAQTKNLF
jgi:hypothetical protein